MKSVKRGRIESAKGVAGGIVGIIFAVFWIIMAVGMGAPGFFPIFGLLIIGLLVFEVIINLKNTTSKNRYSLYDIVDEDEEIDPMNERFNPKPANYCPYCGTHIKSDFKYCPQCGKEL